VVKPSGSISFTLVLSPRTLTLSLISWPLFSSIRPPMKTEAGLVFLIFVNRAW